MSEPIELSIAEEDYWAAFQRYYKLCYFLWFTGVSLDEDESFSHKRFLCDDGTVFGVMIDDGETPTQFQATFYHGKYVEGEIVYQEWTFMSPAIWYGKIEDRYDEYRSTVTLTMSIPEFIEEFFEFIDDYSVKG